MIMPDPTGPELLDALRDIWAASMPLTAVASDAWKRLPVDWYERLRVLLRTPEETSALRAAIEWRFPFREKHCYTGAEGRDTYVALEAAVFAIPSERRDELMREGGADG
jgi:hypothetical protein